MTALPTSAAADAAVATPPALCAVADRSSGGSPVGHATAFAACVAVEVPPPWPYRLYDTTSDAPFAQMRAAYAEAYAIDGGIEAYRAGRARMLIGIAPEAAWAVDGRTRVIEFTRPDGLAAGFGRSEFLVPDDLAIDLVRALFLDRGSVARFARFEVFEPARDVLVCTHGVVDACCGKLGYPLYAALQARPGLRAWRAMHFGGHRFAPTIIDFPSGYSWAHLDRPEAIDAALHGAPPAAALHATLRGYSGMPPAAQVVDAALLADEGVAWRSTPRAARVVHEDEATRTTVVDLEHAAPDGALVRWRGVVGVRRELPLLPCLSSERGEGAVAEYELRSLERMRP